MVEVGRHLHRSSSPNTLLKQAQLQWVAQDYAQTGSAYLQGERPHNLPGKPVPVFGHLHSKKSISERTSVCAHWILHCQWAPLRNPGSVFFTFYV